MKGMSEGTKKLLYLAVAILIGVGMYFLIISPANEEKENLETQVTTLEARYSDLKKKQENEEFYKSDTIVQNETYESILAEFAPGTTQPHQILFVSDLQNKYEYEVSALTLAPDEVYYTHTTNPAIQGVRAELTMTYEGTYKGVKELLYAVKKDEERMTVSGMSLTYNEDSHKLTGEVILDLYAVTGTDRELDPANPGEIEVGRSNVFDKNDTTQVVDVTNPYTATNGEEIKTDYDQFIMINPASSDASAVIVGTKNNDNSVIQTDENASQLVTVKYFMKGDKYYVSYNIGDVTYPADFAAGQEFDPGQNLNLCVVSTNRKDAEDEAAVKVTIINETDKTLNVKVANDDSSNPRFKLVNREGDVQLFK
ncbi:MAG: hypothetical protein IJA10_06420 [Lachnospiraceae bacterium]|nr:hypothetical protein [Lachnospiraceae bacterium]